MPKFSSVLNRPFPVIRRLLRDRRGATAILLAVALSAIVGFAGLGTEVAGWYYTTRSMQSAADAAASSVASEVATATLQGSTVSSTEMTNTGRAIAATFNFVNGTASTTVTVNQPPSSTANLDSSRCNPSFTGFNCYIEVLISQPQTPLLSALFMSTGPTIQSRAVALANTNVTPDGCIVALDSHQGDTGITLSGTPALTLSGCSLIDNSALSNGGTITAQAAYVVGACSGCTSPSLVTTQHPSGSEAYTGTNPYPDPYMNLAAPSYTKGHCDEGSQGSGKKIAGNKTQSYQPASSSTPFVFCGGLDVQGGSTVNLCPGTYIFDQGQLTLEGGGILNAPPTATTTPTISATCPGDTTGGVTIFLTNSSSTSGPPASINIGANSTSSFTAPSSGTYSGIAIFQDRMTCTNHNCGDSFQGGANENLTGVMYFPNNIVSYNGGSSTGGSVCSKLIAYQITFSGNPNFQSSCSSAGTKLLSYTNGQMVM